MVLARFHCLKIVPHVDFFLNPKFGLSLKMRDLLIFRISNGEISFFGRPFATSQTAPYCFAESRVYPYFILPGRTSAPSRR